MRIGPSADAVRRHLRSHVWGRGWRFPSAGAGYSHGHPLQDQGSAVRLRRGQPKKVRELVISRSWASSRLGATSRVPCDRVTSGDGR